MSLFKIREFWSTICDIDEKFDQNCIEISKLNTNCDNIIIGSHVGILRIYQPSYEANPEINYIKGFKPNDLVLEKIFSYPILQISTGKLVSGSQNVHIALLQPKRLSVFTLISKEGATEHGVQNTLKLMYEHKFQRSAANFVIGTFGGSQNRDFIAIQSLDGLLTFYEQESFSFCCFLPDFLLPGPLIYAKNTDSFITVGSTWKVESFRYKRLSEAGQNSQADESSGTRAKSDWSFNMGEGVIDMQYLTISSNAHESYIAILGERNYYCLGDNGILKFMKKLDYPPACFSTYTLDEGDALMTLMVSTTNTIFVYENATVKWSAQLTFLPIAIRRAFIKNIKGAIVVLSEDGKLECCYLGTEPQLFAAPPLTNQPFNYEKTEEELTSLNRIIRHHHSNESKLPNSTAENELQVTISINPHLELVENTQTCIVSISFTPQVVLEHIQISIHVQHPLKCSPEIEFYKKLTEKATFRCNVSLYENLNIPTSTLDVVISYISNVGLPRVIRKTEILPLKLIMETCSPIKESEHKVTININQNPVPVAVLFPEFVGEGALPLTTTTSAVGFKYVNGAGSPVTIMLAKSSQRYRLQSDSFVSLNIVVEQIILRLKKHFSSVSDFHISFNSQLPIPPFLRYVREHFDRRQEVNKLQNKLSQLAAQFRVIQKRLISKFKDKNPTPLANLEKLLHDTNNEIMQVYDELDTAQGILSNAQCDLSCVLYLILNLIKIMDINKELIPILESSFCASVRDEDSQNWENNIESSLCYLLITLLYKSEKDNIKAQYTSEEVNDISKLEKHITQVLDRVIKGGPTLETHLQDVPENEELPSGNGHSEQHFQREALPIGSKIGQSSSRILSARKDVADQRCYDNLDLDVG